MDSNKTLFTANENNTNLILSLSTQTTYFITPIESTTYEPSLIPSLTQSIRQTFTQTPTQTSLTKDKNENDNTDGIALISIMTIFSIILILSITIAYYLVAKSNKKRKNWNMDLVFKKYTNPYNTYN